MQSRFGVVLGVIAVVLAIVAVVGPWWTVDTQATFFGFSGTTHSEYNLFGTANSAHSNLTSSSNTTGYADLPQMGAVFGIATLLMVLGIILGIGTVLIGILPGSNPTFRRFALLAAVLAFLVLLVAGLYVMSSLPAAANTDLQPSRSVSFSGFWGTQSGSIGALGSYSVAWAAGWAWYAVIGAAILFVVAGIAMAVSRKPAMQAFQNTPPPSA